MEQNPLHSSDLNYGVPHLFNEMMDEIVDNTHGTDFDEMMIKDLLETNSKGLAESTGGNSSNNTSKFKSKKMKTNRKGTEVDGEPSPVQDAPRYTEAFYRTVSKITLTPSIKKKTVRFADTTDLADLHSDGESDGDGSGRHFRKNSKTIVISSNGGILI